MKLQTPVSSSSPPAPSASEKEEEDSTKAETVSSVSVDGGESQPVGADTNNDLVDSITRKIDYELSKSKEDDAEDEDKIVGPDQEMAISSISMLNVDFAPVYKDYGDAVEAAAEEGSEEDDSAVLTEQTPEEKRQEE